MKGWIFFRFKFQKMSTVNTSTQNEELVPFTIFTKIQKALIIGIVSVVATLSGFASNIYFPAIPQIAEDLNISTNLVNLTVTCYMIFQGLSPTIWGALSDSKGRRITFICTLSIFIAACVGLAKTRSYAQLLVLRCLQSTGSASTIALGAGVIGDITTRKERGGYMGVFQGGLLLPVAIGPVIGGLLSEKFNWLAVFWFLSIYGIACFVLVVAALPETLRAIVGNGSVEATGLAKSLLGTFQRRRYMKAKTDCTPVSQHCQGKQRKLNLMGSLKVLTHLNTCIAVLFVGIHYMVWQMVLTALSTLAKETYHTSDSQIGLLFLANGIGSIIGTLVIGKFLDFDYRKMVQVYGGDEDQVPAEKARLRTIWIWSSIQCVAVLVFGWTVKSHTHISVPVISLFVLGWTAISIQTVVSTFLVDVHPEQSASATAALNLVRCLLGAAGTAFINPLIEKINIGWTSTFLTALMLVLSAGTLTKVVYGSALRRETASANSERRDMRRDG
jgi:MFS family permease